MKYPHLASRIYNTPLLIAPEKAEIIERVFREQMMLMEKPHIRVDTGALDADMKSGPVPIRRAENGLMIADNGIAIISMAGTLVHRHSYLDAMSGLVSYQFLARQLSIAASDPIIKGILLDIDSAGGEAAGVFDLAAQIRASAKPIFAIANEASFSAAYMLGASAKKLYAPATGYVGSVGVVMMHMDQSEADKMDGLRYTPIYAGARKVDFNSHAPLSSAAKKSAQAKVDHLYKIFVDAVAESRGIEAQAVRDTEAAVLSIHEAIDIGLADDVATFADAFSMLSDEVTGKKVFGQSAALSAHQQKETTMSTEKDQAVAEARAQAFAEGKNEGMNAGMEAERARIKSILQCAEATGRTQLAEHIAFDTAMTAEDAQKILAQAPVAAAADAKSPLAAAMENVANPNVGADCAGDGTATAAAPGIDADAIFKSRDAFYGQ